MFERLMGPEMFLEERQVLPSTVLILISVSCRCLSKQAHKGAGIAQLGNRAEPDVHTADRPHR